MSAWETLGSTIPRMKPWTDIGLKWATKYYKRMDETRAYVIAMCEFRFTITATSSELIEHFSC